MFAGINHLETQGQIPRYARNDKMRPNMPNCYKHEKLYFTEEILHKYAYVP